MFDLPRAVDRVVDVLGSTEPVTVDYGRVRWKGPRDAGSSIFVNVAGVGFDAKVAAAAARLKLLRGTVRYLAAVLRTLRSWESPTLRIVLYEDGQGVESIDEQVLLALVGNGRCAAGGFYLTPDASISDGRLDALIVRNAGPRRILSLIPGVLRGAGLENQPEVTVHTVDVMEVVSQVPVAIQADGEVLTEGATSVQFEIVPDGLSVVMPVTT